MFSVSIRDHVMIAHSFNGEIFGPAQRLHGATYVVDVELRSAELDPSGVVVDIGRASEALRAMLATLNYRNLDEVPELAGKNTTTEFLSRFICQRLADAARAGALGPGSTKISAIKVTLHESHVAWASYEQELPRHD
ncbi:MAG: 6-pyruvoyl trahydropterin synthase family protein [Polyangia bacterium]